MRGDTVAAMNSRKIFCIRGHLFTKENTYIRKDRNGRNCRICRYESVRKFTQKKLIGY